MPFQPNGQAAVPVEVAEQPAPVQELLGALGAGGWAPPPHVIAPQLGLLPKKKFITKAVINPALPKMEFNTEAKKNKPWVRPTTRQQVKDAIAAGMVICEQYYEDEEENATPWAPFKFPDVSKISASRFSLLQIHPDKKYILTRAVTLTIGNNKYFSHIRKPDAAAFKKWEEDTLAQGRTFQWVEGFKFFVVDKETQYV